MVFSKTTFYFGAKSGKDKKKEQKYYLFVTKNVERPESLSILSMGTIEVSSLIYLIHEQHNGQMETNQTHSLWNVFKVNY